MIKINFTNKTPLKIDEQWLVNTAKKIFGLVKKSGNYECEINIICQERMKALNQKFRNKDKATTILSFVANENKDFILPPSKYQYLGEILLCPTIIEKEAKSLEISTEKLMTRLLIHGILHLVGYTHQSHKDAQRMECKEEKINNRLIKS